MLKYKYKFFLLYSGKMADKKKSASGLADSFAGKDIAVPNDNLYSCIKIYRYESLSFNRKCTTRGSRRVSVHTFPRPGILVLPKLSDIND